MNGRPKGNTVRLVVYVLPETLEIIEGWKKVHGTVGKAVDFMAGNSTKPEIGVDATVEKKPSKKLVPVLDENGRKVLDFKTNSPYAG